MENTKFFTLFFVIVMISFSCSHTTKTSSVELELNKIQRQFASTNFQLDSLTSKVDSLESELKRQTDELELLKHNSK